MKRFVEGTDRGQSTLLPECLDDWIDENNPVRVIDAFVEALDLRELGFAGVEPEITGRAERMAVRDRENAQRLADESRRVREHREATERQRQGQRREIIQSVKHEVLEYWIAPVQGRSDLKARALQEIERKLAALSVEELPRLELVLIAEAARDSVYREAVQAAQHARDMAARRQSLIEHGCGYAGRELRRAEGLPITEVWAIERRVREELASAEGDETTDDIEDWVDGILEDEGIEWDEDDD
jgi:hypothetical protein